MNIGLILLATIGLTFLSVVIGFGWLLWHYKDKEYEETKLFLREEIGKKR